MAILGKLSKTSGLGEVKPSYDKEISITNTVLRYPNHGAVLGAAAAAHFLKVISVIVADENFKLGGLEF